MSSKHGTFVREKGGWRRIQETPVSIADSVRFGTLTIDVSEIMKLVESGRPLRQGGYTIERNPETGEIIKKLR